MTFPAKFSERMRAAMFPQQNLKRREAAFLLARRRFAPAKCRNALLLSSKSAKLSFSQEKLLTTHCHEPAHISHQWTCESVSGSHLRSEATRRIPQRCYDPSDDRDGTAGFRQHNLSSTRTNVRFLSSLGRLVLSSMLDAKEQGRSARESTIIPFSESRYRSSDVGRAHLQTGEAHLFISAPSGRYNSLYFASQSRSNKHGICAHKVRHSCADGDTPYPVIRTKDSAYNGNLWRVPITAQSSTNATDHDALQPLRGSEADCVRSLIRQSIPSRPQHRSKRRAHRARRDGAKPHFR